MRIKHTDDSVNASNFAQRHPGWHTFAKDRRTRKAIERAAFLGAVETNEFSQFRALPQNGLPVSSSLTFKASRDEQVKAEWERVIQIQDNP